MGLRPPNVSPCYRDVSFALLRDPHIVIGIKLIFTPRYNGFAQEKDIQMLAMLSVMLLKLYRSTPPQRNYVCLSVPCSS